MYMGSYWDKYNWVLNKKLISTKGMEVCQNIQDVCHNCAKLKVARDDLVKTTTMVSHDDDRRCQEDSSENTISFEEVAEMLQQLDDFGIREVHPTQRSLNIIASRVKIVQQNIPESETAFSNITDILEGVAISCGL